MCSTFCLSLQQAIQIKGWATKVEVEKQAHRMGQHFTNQPMLERTEATDSKPDHSTTPIKSSTRSSKGMCLSLKTSKTYRPRWNNSARLQKNYLSKQPYSRLAWRSNICAASTPVRRINSRMRLSHRIRRDCSNREPMGWNDPSASLNDGAGMTIRRSANSARGEVASVVKSRIWAPWRRAISATPSRPEVRPEPEPRINKSAAADFRSRELSLKLLTGENFGNCAGAIFLLR